MVRSYRKYEADRTFGTICTATSNTIWTPSSNKSTGRAYSSANEDVLCWDLKTSELVSRWHDNDNNSEVTHIASCTAQPDLVAVGYNDGSLRIWDALSGQIVLTFNGHRSAITQLCFDSDGVRLISGSRDTDIIVWNLLSETAEFRLRGHKDQITGLGLLRTPTSTRQSPHTDEAIDVTSPDAQEREERYLISTSKDALIKIWDLTNPACIETHVAQSSGECWALGLNTDTDGCISAGNDGELKVWSIDLLSLAELESSLDIKKSDLLKSQGILHRQSKDRTLGVHFHTKHGYIAMHGSEKAVEIWRIRSADEIHKHMQRKRRRRREKAAAGGQEASAEDDAPEVGDVFIPHVIVRTNGKLRSIDWVGKGTSKALSLLTATTNNQLELFTVATATRDTATAEYDRASGVDLPGHRADIRALALSSDDRMLASASNGQLKVWNMKTRSCLRTLECGQALCAAFLPGDRIVLLGTKSGDLELHDISTSTLIESIKSHEGAVWTLAVHPDGKSVVTGSADKTARFWRFDVVEEEIPGTRRTTQRLKLTQTRELRLSDEILSVAFSPDERLLAASTLDNTVKVFFTDSLKLFLTLYGHKLPVLSVSISSDSKLIATCSADKNVRIWGLDFGDCHKAFFAHQDSVMSVSFIPHPVEADEKHIAFSCSKDGTIKTWDADKFVQVQRLDGHKGEIWAMAVSQSGETVVTAGHDKAIRIHSIGDDLVFLAEERERELEEIYEATLAQNLDRDHRGDEAQRDDDVAAAGKQTISTLTHGEKLMEALEQSTEDLALMQAYERDKETNPKVAIPQRNPIFLALGNITAEQHVMKVLQKIPSPSLNDALLVVPFSTLPQLFMFLAIFLEKRVQPTLAWRVAYFLLQAHMQQIIASRNMRQVLSDTLQAFEQWQEEESRVIGYNLAGLEIMSREARENEQFSYVDDTTLDTEEDLTKGRKKRAFANIA